MGLLEKRDGGLSSTLFFILAILVIAALLSVIVRGVLAQSPAPSPSPGSGQEWFDWMRRHPMAVKRTSKAWQLRNHSRNLQIMVKLPGPPWTSGSEGVRSVSATAIFAPKINIAGDVIGLNKQGWVYTVSDSTDIGIGPPTFVEWTQGVK